MLMNKQIMQQPSILGNYELMILLILAEPKLQWRKQCKWYQMKNRRLIVAAAVSP